MDISDVLYESDIIEYLASGTGKIVSLTKETLQDTLLGSIDEHTILLLKEKYDIHTTFYKQGTTQGTLLLESIDCSKIQNSHSSDIIAQEKYLTIQDKDRSEKIKILHAKLIKGDDLVEKRTPNIVEFDDDIINIDTILEKIGTYDATYEVDIKNIDENVTRVLQQNYRKDQHNNRLSPREMLNEFKRCNYSRDVVLHNKPERGIHIIKIKDANLEYSLLMSNNIVIDGIHRLTKAYGIFLSQKKQKSIICKVKDVDKNDIEKLGQLSVLEHECSQLVKMGAIVSPIFDINLMNKMSFQDFQEQFGTNLSSIESNTTYQSLISKGLILGHNEKRIYNEQFYGWHNGLDIMVAAGTKVVSIGNGEVVEVVSSSDKNPNAGYGNTIVIKYELPSGNKIFVRYAHLGRLQNMLIGKSVLKGEKVGEIGNNGAENGGWPSHLHFQIMTNHSSDSYDHEEKGGNSLITTNLDPSKIY